jgi:hypothetical protein
MASYVRPQTCRPTPIRHFAVLGGILTALWAASGAAQAPQGASPAKPQPAATTVVLTRADCSRLTAHVPAADVTYQPGVDVRGRAVAPADLAGPPPLVMPSEITIAITVDLQQRFGIPATSSLYKPEATIGTVVVRPDGSASFNGQPLTSQEQSALAYLCQRQGPLGK